MVKLIGNHTITVLYPNQCYKEVRYKGTALYVILFSLDGLGTNDIIDHPLALPDESPMEGNHIDDFISDYKGSNLSLNNSESAMIKSASFTVEKLKPAGHGMCLTTSDHDRLRIFIHEFAVRALIPWAERQMKLLSDVVRV